MSPPASKAPESFELRVGWGTVLVRAWSRATLANQHAAFAPRDSAEGLAYSARRDRWNRVAEALIAAFEAEGWTVPKKPE